MLNDVTVVLQGYPYDVDGLIQTYNYYKSIGLNNIIISSYEEDLSNFESNFIDTLMVYNDDLKSTDRYINGSYSIYRHINTTVRGIHYSREHLGEDKTKYIFKCRCDHKINNLDKWILKWKGYLNENPPPSDNIFKNKLVLLAGPIYNEPWYLCDYWSFGLYEDSFNYWNVNLNANYKMGNAEKWIAFSLLGDKHKINIHPSKYEDYFISARDKDPYILVDNYSFKFKTNFYDMPGQVARDNKTKKQIQPRPVNPFI